MRSMLGCLLAVTLLGLAASAGRMQAAPARARAAAASHAVGPTGVALPAADPMVAELQRELERGQREYAELFRRLTLAHGEEEALGIEQDMRRQRVELQVSLLQVQAAYARRAGHNAFADQLERAIAALTAAESPAPPAAPDPRRGM
jgi:hypothetical protein